VKLYLSIEQRTIFLGSNFFMVWWSKWYRAA